MSRRQTVGRAFFTAPQPAPEAAQEIVGSIDRLTLAVARLCEAMGQRIEETGRGYCRPIRPPMNGFWTCFASASRRRESGAR